MPQQQSFIALPDKKVDPCLGIIGVKLFNKGRGENHIADKGGLYNQEFLHRAKVKYNPAEKPGGKIGFSGDRLMMDLRSDRPCRSRVVSQSVPPPRST